MLSFIKLTLQHRNLLETHLEKQSCLLCDYSVGVLLLWRDFFHTEIAVSEDSLFIKQKIGEHTFFPFPISPDWKTALKAIEEYCLGNNLPFQFCNISKDQLVLLKQQYPLLETSTDRNWYDYLYETQDLIFFRGKKYHGQKNHRNKFWSIAPDAVFEEISEKNISSAKTFFLQHYETQEKNNIFLQEECRIFMDITEHYDAYGLFGGILRVKDKTVALALGSKNKNTLFVHIEKADTTYPGAYQAIVSKFAEYFTDDSILYINREEDMGDAGLRTSKLSYHPVALLEKHTAGR